MQKTAQAPSAAKHSRNNQAQEANECNLQAQQCRGISLPSDFRPFQSLVHWHYKSFITELFSSVHHLRSLSEPSMRFALLAQVALVGASGVLEVDLVFPRNDTYAPTDSFPVVFAFQNAEYARFLNPHVSYRIWNWATLPGNDSVGWSHDLRWTNWSSHEPFFLHNYLSDFTTEGHYRVDWSLTWESCDEDAFAKNLLRDDLLVRNESSHSTSFTIKDSGPQVDLVAATSANTSCPSDDGGIGIKITDRTMHVPSRVNWSGGDSTNDTCVVVDSSGPTPTPDPCQVTITSAVAASMEASLKARLCDELQTVDRPDDCPNDDNSAQRLAVLGGSCGLAVLGGLGLLLV
ncbi:uncharacterized protein BJX67DRAFT_31343 [Aspergillus lucknowensis]|uniref:DUF7136 domain-containing protein n=1 Tax=Aspergillus lucknowensis TaxID=176173 RepID=A0ABR4LWT5_9EURO